MTRSYALILDIAFARLYFSSRVSLGLSMGMVTLRDVYLSNPTTYIIDRERGVYLAVDIWSVGADVASVTLLSHWGLRW